MGLFEKRRRATDLEQVDVWDGDGDEDAAADIIIDLARTEPVPVIAREQGPAPRPHVSTGRYDYSGPAVARRARPAGHRRRVHSGTQR